MSRRKNDAPAAGKKDHVAIGLQYARDVVSGAILACEDVRLACERQLRDLERAEADESWPFRWDPAAGGRAARFFETLPHIQGDLARKRAKLSLEPWQCFVVTTVYGWIRRDSPKGRKVRRFARIYQEEPRGNGKSFMLSGALLYSFTEGEPGVESYSAAVDRAQSKKVHGIAASMLRKDPRIAKALGLQVSASAIYQLATHGQALALSREAKTAGDGLNIYFAAVDELHAHRGPEVWNVLDSGTGKRDGNALIWIITTAGFNMHGVCYERRTYARKILRQEVQDDSWFVIIYALDAGDDWTDEKCRANSQNHADAGCIWRKANPNWGVSVDPVDFEAKGRRAMSMLSEQTNFLTKHLDVWCNADVPWMDMRAWDACADAKLDPEQFRADPCVLGLDLASKVDVAAKIRLFYRDLPSSAPDAEPDTTERHYYVFLVAYLPEERVREAGGDAQYRGWQREGRVTVTPGQVLDLATVQAQVAEDCEAFGVREVAFDPWQATQMASELQKSGIVMVELRPTVQNFSEPMKEIGALVLQGRLHHDGDPVLRWMISNVVAAPDSKDNIYPRKTAPENKIDGAVALIMAMNRAILAPEAPPRSYLETQQAVVV